jgi:hypothetical protein
MTTAMLDPNRSVYNFNNLITFSESVELSPLRKKYGWWADGWFKK